MSPTTAAGPLKRDAAVVGHVLVIEDDHVMRMLECIALRDKGWTVSEATTGTEGVALARALLPEVIICDRRLPDVDGIQVIESLAADPSTASIPVVLVTGMGETDDIVAGINAGAHDYLVKPFKMIELEVRCRAALRVSRQHRLVVESETAYRRIVDLAAEGVWVIDAAQTITFANRRMGQLLGVEHTALVGRPATDFMDQEGKDLATARMDQRRAGLSGSGDFRFVRADGTSVWTAFNAAPILDEEGAFQGAIALISDVTLRHEHEEALARSEARYRALLDHLPDTVAIVYDENLRAAVVTGQGLNSRGVGGADMVGKRFDQIVAAADVPTLEHLYRAALGGVATSVEFQSHLTGLDNLLDVVPISTQGGAPSEILVVARNIGPLKDRERALSAAEQRWRAAFDRAPVGMAQVGVDGRFLRVNPALCAMVGYSAERLEKLTPVDISHPDDAARARQAIQDVGNNTLQHFRDEKRYIHARGHIVWCAVSAVPVHGRDGRVDYMLVHYLDISELKRVADELRQLAVHDPLTGLLNRRGFSEALDRHVAQVQRYGPAGALLIVDLDGLKFVNDTQGHEAGDQVIATTADILRRRLRSTDTVARLGGDEFAIILSRVDPEQVGRVADALVRRVRRTFSSGTVGRSVTASVGVAFFDPACFDPPGVTAGGTPGVTAEEVLVAADRAMYDAKSAGRDRYAMARPDQLTASNG